MTAETATVHDLLARAGLFPFQLQLLKYFHWVLPPEEQPRTARGYFSRMPYIQFNIMFNLHLTRKISLDELSVAEQAFRDWLIAHRITRASDLI